MGTLSRALWRSKYESAWCSNISMSYWRRLLLFSITWALSIVCEPDFRSSYLMASLKYILASEILSNIIGSLHLLDQPWTSHGLHGSWVGRWRESLRIHGQPTSADIRDFHYFLGSADVGQKQRKVYTISCVLIVRRCTQCLGNKLQHFYICDFKSGHQIISLSIWDIINS